MARRHCSGIAEEGRVAVREESGEPSEQRSLGINQALGSIK